MFKTSVNKIFCLAFIFSVFLASCSNSQANNALTPKLTTPIPTHTVTLRSPSFTPTITITPTRIQLPTSTLTPTPPIAEHQLLANIAAWNKINSIVNINQLEKKSDGKYYKAGTDLLIFDPITGHYDYDFIFWIASKTCLNSGVNFVNWSSLPDSQSADRDSRAKFSAMEQSLFSIVIGEPRLFTPIKNAPGCWFIKGSLSFAFIAKNNEMYILPLINGEKLKFNALQGNWTPVPNNK